MKKQNVIAEANDRIGWICPKHFGDYSGKILKADVVWVDPIQKTYAVYTPYGLDFIKFKDAAVLLHKKRRVS